MGGHRKGTSTVSMSCGTRCDIIAYVYSVSSTLKLGITPEMPSEYPLVAKKPVAYL